MNKKQMFMKIFALIFAAALILPFGKIKAQESQPETVNAEQTSPVPAVSSEAEMDENVTAEDLNIKEPTLLPASPYYQIKNLWRGLKSTLTLDPVKKVELKLQYANEKLIEAKKTAELKNEPELAAKALESYTKEINGLAKTVENFSDKLQKRADELASKIIDNSFKQQKLIDGIEKTLEGGRNNETSQAKNQSLENLGATIANLVPPEQIQNQINLALQNQTGSEFKDFKNLEVLKAVEQKVPEQAREAVRQAQANVLQNLERKINQVQEKEKLQNYLENVGGNQALQLTIIQEMIQKDIPEATRQELEKAAEKTVEKTEKKIQTLNEEQKNNFLAPLQQGNIENLRTLKELENNFSPETVDKILEVKNTAIDDLRKNLENPASPETQTALLNKIEKLKDIKQLEIIKEVEKIVSQEKKELLTQAKEKIVNEIENEISAATTEEQKNLVLRKIAGNSPEQIETIKEAGLPKEVINVILDKQAEKIQEKIQNTQDMEKIQYLKEKMQNVGQELKIKMPEILNRVEEKIEEITSEKAKKQLDKAKSALEELVGDELFKKYLNDSNLIEVAKKHLAGAETAFNQNNFGQAFGQATAGLQQIASLKRMIKERELQQNVAQDRVQQMEQKMENLVNDFLRTKTESGRGTEIMEKISDEIKQGTLEKEWLEYQKGVEPPANAEKTTELPLDKMNLSEKEKEQIKDAIKILPQQIKEKLNDIPEEMLIDTTKKLKEKIISPIITEEKKTKIANPASEYCIKMGGKLEIKTDKNGGQFGICHLPNGTNCEEWALFKGECGKNSDKKKPNNGPACPEASKPDCEKGVLVAVEKDKNGCPLKYECMGLGEKPLPEKPIPSTTPSQPAIPSQPRIIEPTKPIPSSLPARERETNACIQVITPAMKDGICKEFPTPCDVPNGWSKVDKCPNSADPRIQREIPTTNSQLNQIKETIPVQEEVKTQKSVDRVAPQR